MAATAAAEAPPGPDVFHMGPGTLRICRGSLHAKLREKLVQGLRAALPAEKQGLVFLQGGQAAAFNLYSSDMERLFLQEAYFHYAFGVAEEDWAGAIDVRTGAAVLFMPRLPESYAVWMGALKSPAEMAAKYSVSAVYYRDQMAEQLRNMAAAHNADLPLHVLSGTNTDSGLALAPPSDPALQGFELETGTLFNVMTECRVAKIPEEIEVIRYANAVGSAGHVAAMQSCRAGQMEYHLESTFLHHCYSSGGCRSAKYTPISASGPNGAVLHYGHAGAPNDRQLAEGDLVLADMGCEYYVYGSDITTTWPVGGKFSPQQRVVYEAVLSAHDAVLKAMRPGVSWLSLHELAYLRILEGLLAGGIVTGGSAQQLLEADVAALFMPHGLGHFLGLDTHDVGGYPPKGPSRSARPGFSRLRTARNLEEDMVITVEPGCYFNPALLLPALEDPAKSQYLVRDAVLAHMSLGGVRLEDNVVVTAAGAESLTDVPRSVADVEAVMAGARWPRPAGTAQ